MIEGFVSLFGSQATAFMQSIMVWNLWLALLLLLILGCRHVLYRYKASAIVIHRLWLAVPAFLLVTAIALIWPAQPVTAPLDDSGAWDMMRLPGMLIRAESASSLDFLHWAFFCWLPIAALLGYRLVRTYRRALSRLKLKASMQTDPWTSSEINAAVCVGIIRPRIVVSEHFESRFSAQQQQHLMHHESVHQQRLDPAWRLLSEILRVLCWFNPMVHLAASRFYRDQEISCDERVLQHRSQEERVAYARLLGELMTEHNNPALVCTSGSTVKERIMRIAYLNQVKPGRRLSLLGLLMLTSTVAIGAELATRLPVAALPAQSSAEPEEIERELIEKEASLQTAREREDELMRANESLRAEEARLAAEVERLQLQQEELERKQRELLDNREQLQQRHEEMQRARQERQALVYQEAQQARQQAEELAQEAEMRRQEAREEMQLAEQSRREAEQLRERAETMKQESRPFEIVSRTPPKYPRTAAIERIEGFVELEFDLMPDGKIVNIRVLESVPENVFDKVAIDAVSSWELVNNTDKFLTLSERLEFQLNE